MFVRAPLGSGFLRLRALERCDGEHGRDRQERDRVGKEGGLDPGAGDHEAGERGPAGGADGEGDVEERIALTKLARGCEHGGGSSAGHRARRGGDRAVEGREDQDEGEREVVDE